MERIRWKPGLWLALGLAWVATAPSHAQETPTTTAKDPIIVNAPVSAGERRKQLREFTKEIVRPPRRNRAIARFRFPICPLVKGIAPADARAIEQRIRENAQRWATGANTDPGCTPTVMVAFMAPKAGPPTRWLTKDSKQLSHLPIYQRRRVLAENAPVRAWSRVVLRDQFGQPVPLTDPSGRAIGEQDGPTLVDPFSASDPLLVSETTGAAVLIEREAAEGFTLAQLADYITMRALIDISTPDAEKPIAAPTILTLFHSATPAQGLTPYDEALLEGVYKAPRNSSPRRVFNNTASMAVRAERGAPSGVDE